LFVTTERPEVTGEEVDERTGQSVRHMDMHTRDWIVDIDKKSVEPIVEALDYFFPTNVE